MILTLGFLLQILPMVPLEIEATVTKSRRAEALTLPVQVYQTSEDQGWVLKEFGEILGYPEIKVDEGFRWLNFKEDGEWAIDLPFSPTRHAVFAKTYGVKRFKFDDEVYTYFFGAQSDKNVELRFSSVQVYPRGVKPEAKTVRLHFFRKETMESTARESVPEKHRDEFELYLDKWARKWEEKNQRLDGYFSYAQLEFRAPQEGESLPLETDKGVWVYPREAVPRAIPLLTGAYLVEKSIIRQGDKERLQAEFHLGRNDFESLRERDWSRLED